MLKQEGTAMAAHDSKDLDVSLDSKGQFTSIDDLHQSKSIKLYECPDNHNSAEQMLAKGQQGDNIDSGIVPTDAFYLSEQNADSQREEPTTVFKEQKPQLYDLSTVELSNTAIAPETFSLHTLYNTELNSSQTKPEITGQVLSEDIAIELNSSSVNSRSNSDKNARNERGKLKIFLGAAPGVGKTFAMLTEANEKRKQGMDIVIGWIDTHGRNDSQSILSQLEIVPRLHELVHGCSYERLDVQGIIKRNPDTVVIDEMPWTNPPYCTNNKRWQDIDEILDHGINVYSALNIQHLDSLNGVVARVTGVEFLETVPDSIFDRADEIRLVDLPPDDLILRLESGKIFLPPAVEKVKANYFKKSNLIALRELTLRYMTNRVDSDAKLNRHNSAHESVEDTNFGLLLVLEYITDLDAIRQAARIAHSLSGGWHCIFVKRQSLNDKEGHEVNSMLQFAQSLGATTDIVVGSYAQAVSGYARSHNLSIVAIVPTSRWRFALQRRFLRENAPELNILSLTYKAKTPKFKQRLSNLFKRRSGQSLGIIQVIIGNLLLSALFYPLFGMVHRTNFAMGYLMLTFYFSVRYGTIAASLSAFISIFCFDLWSVEPRGSLVISDIQYFWSFMTMLIVGLVAARLIAHRQEMTYEANSREQQTRMLYDAARDMSPATDDGTVFNIIVRIMHNDLNIDCEFWRYDKGSDNIIRQQSKLQGVDVNIVRWCINNKQEAGEGTANFMHTQYLYLPLVSSTEVFGVAVLKLCDAKLWLDPNSQRLILALIALTSQTLERLRSVEEARQTLMNMEASRLRNSLLQSLSHDLRTPLTSVMNNAETLVSKINKKEYDLALHEAQDLFDSTQRLVRLTSNLIEMARLQNDVVTLKKTWFPPEELIGMAKASLKDRLKKFNVITKISDTCPLIYGDPVLLERVLANILDNATKYCNDGATIKIEACQEDNMLNLSISDNGPGLPEDKQQLFEPFRRGKKESTIAGVGLGLAICKNIAQVHNGQITASNGDMGGACFTLSLPIVEPPELDDEELMLQKIQASEHKDGSLAPLELMESNLNSQDQAILATSSPLNHQGQEPGLATGQGPEQGLEQAQSCDDDEVYLALKDNGNHDNYNGTQNKDAPTLDSIIKSKEPHKKGKYDDLIIG